MGVITEGIANAAGITGELVGLSNREGLSRLRWGIAEIAGGADTGVESCAGIGGSRSRSRGEMSV
jgi:hypothetical protein